MHWTKISGAVVAAALALWMSSSSAEAAPATPVSPCVVVTTTTQGYTQEFCVPVTAANPLPITGSFSATVAPFAPAGSYSTPLSASNASSRTALPSSQPVVVVYNTGSVAAYVALGNASVTATTSDDVVQPGSWIALGVGSNVDIAAITASSTTTLNISGGSGLPAGSGGGSSGGGGGTVAQGTAAAAAGAWPMYLVQGTTANSSSNPIFAQITAGSAAIGSITNSSFAATQATAANLNATVVGTGTFATQLTGATNNINNIGGTISLPTGAATAANQSTEITSLSTIATNTGSAIPAGTALIGNVGQVYPAGATAITASATGTTAATTATLAANASLHTYICGMSIRANATAAATGNATITGTVTGTLNFTQWTAPLASGLGVTEEIFTPCVVSSAVNTGIAVISAAPGTGGTVSVSAWGFQL